MPYIGKQPTVGNFQVCDAISVVNGQAAYTMQVGSANVTPESANHMLVSLNGVVQKPGSSFTISGSTITFASNLATGDVIDFIILLGDVLNIGTPSDDTVATASIQANAVTAAKLNNDVISGLTALGAEPADTDEFLISDAGTIKRLDYSYIKGGGKVLQVVGATSTNETTTTSTSYQAVTDGVSITPSATSSKVLLFANFETSGTDSAIRVATSFFRDSTEVTGGSRLAQRTAAGNTTSAATPDQMSMVFLDSPSTTSQVTYKIAFKRQDNQSGTVKINDDQKTLVYVAMEIGA
jgi:hypothetical protein